MALSKTKQSVLNNFEARNDDWTYGDFENALEEAMGGHYKNYQTAKATISEAHKSGQWPRTVERYVMTNYKSFGNVPGELLEASREMYQRLTPQQKQQYGIK